jgi:hypothetical protein
MPNTSLNHYALRSRFWYRQFREIVLLFALNNIKKLAETL